MKQESTSDTSDTTGLSVAVTTVTQNSNLIKFDFKIVLECRSVGVPMGFRTSFSVEI
jgi:hypothetical protein